MSLKKNPLLFNKRLGELQLLVRNASLAGKRFEGTADGAELNYLASLAMLPEVKMIEKIGFNGGASSFAFLFANRDATVISFDLGEYGYVQPAKDIIDDECPKRHKLILGDSTKTVPEYHKSHPKLKFDLIFVDGGHDYEIAKADIKNMKKLAHKDTILVTDDLNPWKPWGIGPYHVWTEAVESGLVIQDELVKDGTVVTEVEPPGERIYARGRHTNP